MSIAILAPEWIDEQNKRLAIITDKPKDLPVLNQLAALFREMVDTIEDGFHELLDSTDDSTPMHESYELLWYYVCELFRQNEATRQSIRKSAHHWFGLALPSRSIREANQELCSQHFRLIELMRLILVSKPDWNLTLPPDLKRVVWAIHISPLAYLRAMANLFWSAIRHPFSNTTIDLNTGHVLYRA